MLRRVLLAMFLLGAATSALAINFGLGLGLGVNRGSVGVSGGSGIPAATVQKPGGVYIQKPGGVYVEKPN
jgi:hypothetical protein